MLGRRLPGQSGSPLKNVIISKVRLARRQNFYDPVRNGSGPVRNGSGPVRNGSGPVRNGPEQSGMGPECFRNNTDL